MAFCRTTFLRHPLKYCRLQVLRSEEPVDSRRHIHMSEGENHGPIRHTIHPSPPTNPHAYVTNPHGDLVETSRELE